jgi:hypothetical protein
MCFPVMKMSVLTSFGSRLNRPLLNPTNNPARRSVFFRADSPLDLTVSFRGLVARDGRSTPRKKLAGI